MALRLARSSGIMGIQKESKMLWKWLSGLDLCLFATNSTCIHVMILDKNVILRFNLAATFRLPEVSVTLSELYVLTLVRRIWAESRKDGKEVSCKLKLRKL